ncbi:hypothetical protein GINT2_002145 [Glugoides intestinalis]
MRFSIVLIASTLISCYFFTVEELESLKRLEKIYGKMPTNEKERVGFANDIDPILDIVPLENSEVFNKFAPFLLYSEKHNYMLKDMDLRLVYETKNENIKKHWKINADKIVKSLRCSFNVDKINDDEIEFFENFSKLTKVELFCPCPCPCPYFFNKSKTWSNSKKVLSKLKEIPACTELELVRFNSDILKDFIDGAAKSKSEALQHLKKLKIIFKDDSGILYLNSAVGKFSSLFKPLSNLSEITIENQATTYNPIKGHESGNLVNLINGLPEKIAINLIGRFVESNQGPEYVNALKKEQKIVNALEEKSDTGKVSIVYKFDSFDKKKAQWLRDKIGDSKLDIRIFGIRNGIKRPIEIPITTEILDNLLKVEYFEILFDDKIITVMHTNMNDFLSSFGPFFEEREWNRLIYTDKNPRTEIRELLEFVETFNKCKSIMFRSNFLDFKNENDTNGFISVVNKRHTEFELYTSAILIDSEDFIKIYNKMQRNKNFTLNVNSWLIRVRKGKVGAFILHIPKTYNMELHEIRQKNEFLDNIKALSELDCFKPDVMNTNVLYVEDGNFDDVFWMLKTIKYMFEKVIVANNAFKKDQIEKLREELRNGGSCTLEILTEESLLNSWLRSQ